MLKTKLHEQIKNRKKIILEINIRVQYENRLIKQLQKNNFRDCNFIIIGLNDRHYW